MYTFLSNAYEFLASFLPFLTIFLLLRRRQAAPGAWFLSTALALYVIGVFYVTGTGTIYDVLSFLDNSLEPHMNLIPFSRDISIPGYVLNVVMLIPLGILLPLMWEKMRSLPRVMLTGFCFSLVIELSQLFCHRGTDVDDLLMNTAGAAVGYLLYRLWDALTASRFRQNSLPATELPIYFAALFLGRFLLFHRMALIGLIYGI